MSHDATWTRNNLGLLVGGTIECVVGGANEAGIIVTRDGEELAAFFDSDQEGNAIGDVKVYDIKKNMERIRP